MCHQGIIVHDDDLVGDVPESILNSREEDGEVLGLIVGWEDEGEHEVTVTWLYGYMARKASSRIFLDHVTM